MAWIENLKISASLQHPCVEYAAHTLADATNTSTPIPAMSHVPVGPAGEWRQYSVARACTSNPLGGSRSSASDKGWIRACREGRAARTGTDSGPMCVSLEAVGGVHVRLESLATGQSQRGVDRVPPRLNWYGIQTSGASGRRQHAPSAVRREGGRRGLLSARIVRTGQPDLRRTRHTGLEDTPQGSEESVDR